MLLSEAWAWCVEHHAEVKCSDGSVSLESEGSDLIIGITLEDAVELAVQIEMRWTDLNTPEAIEELPNHEWALSADELDDLVSTLESLGKCG